jgi:uncharacterized protein YbbK (DUF523 family)
MLLISACLAGVPCKYSGGHNLNIRCKALVEQGKAILVCPEALAGLPIPRPPVEIIGGDGYAVLAGKTVVRDKNSVDKTSCFIKGAEAVLAIATEHGIVKAILKERSPSCGSSTIYDGTFTGTTRPGVGVTTALLKNHGIEVVNEKTM